MKPKVTFGTSGNTYSINPSAANVVGDSYARTNSISNGGPTIAYGDPRAVTNVRTSGVGSYGASSGQVRYTLPQASINTGNTGNYVEGVAYRTPSYIQTQGQEIRTSSQYANVARPQLSQEVRVTAPTYVNQSVPVTQVYQNQVAANPVYTQDYGRTTYTNNKVSSNANVAVHEEKKAGFDCSPICWGLLGLLGLLGLVLGLLFGLGVIGGGGQNTNMGTASASSGNQTTTIAGTTTTGTTTNGGTSGTTTTTNGGTSGTTTTTNGGTSGTTTTGTTTNGGTSGTTTLGTTTSTSTSTSTNTGTTSSTVGGQTGTTTTVNTSASISPTVVAPISVQTTQWNSGATSGTSGQTSGTTTVNGSGLQTNTRTFTSQQFGPIPIPVTHLTNLHEY